MSKFKDILLPIANILERKNHDYNNSYDKLRDQFGPVAFYVRVYDKLMRIEQLDRAEAQVKEESVFDSLEDLVGYCVLEIIYRKRGIATDVNKKGNKH